MDTKRNEASLSFRNSAHPPRARVTRADAQELGYAHPPAARNASTGHRHLGHENVFLY